MFKSFNALPQEILEHIAFLVALQTFLGPPSSILPFISINRWTNSSLSFSSNTCLYARIFEHKFDVRPAIRRIGLHRLSTSTLSEELRKRCIYLKRIKSRIDACTDEENNGRDDMLREVLNYAYLFMLENEGRNERQLREYAHIDLWLKDYWFSELGASGARRAIASNRWPVQNLNTIIAMWLYWFLLKPETYQREKQESWKAVDVLKVFALGAHTYHLSSPTWLDFLPKSESFETDISEVIFYSEKLHFRPPPLAVPAILSFISLVSQLQEQTDFSTPFVSLDSTVSKSLGGMEWEREWGRCYSLGQPSLAKFLTLSFIPGSLEGVWEGLFTYTDFTAYAALLQGAPPLTLQKSLVVRHRQTWRLREHYLISNTSRSVGSDSGIEIGDNDNVEALSAGDPLRSYFSTGTFIRQHEWGVEVREPHKKPLHYRRADSDTSNSKVLDIIIMGEGHSAWGQFSLVGRIRPCDGFISLSKDYIDGDRGKWLYRGYLVGNANSNLAGRWRDTVSPVRVPGYEGCFTMTRRR
ncbi:hypothetical protein E1B28_013688 [Marasmius oreades]|uniref:F-box domain-containing protein n=1 Tax=Marasmius oreades TaxID=181124 RepID=A0A9P7RQC1_9AGAR|nr:uncharacterized protein E1B28_013688 [Marasmius oreades]KAG7087747.1 hypothetical protein E1B28_013688 [Marasmius oreades]